MIPQKDIIAAELAILAEDVEKLPIKPEKLQVWTLIKELTEVIKKMEQFADGLSHERV